MLFSVPDASCTLVAFVASSEVIGLIAVNSNGDVMYWENIAMGVNACVKVSLPFSDGEDLQAFHQVSVILLRAIIYSIDIILYSGYKFSALQD